MSKKRLWMVVAITACGTATGCSSAGNFSPWPSTWFGGGATTAGMGQPRNVSPQGASSYGATAQLGSPAAASSGPFAGMTASFKKWTGGDSAVSESDPLSLEGGPQELRPEVHMYLARDFESKGRWDQAIVQYQQALAKNPRNTDILVAMARCHDHSGDMAKAVATYEHALRVDPRCALAHNDLGLCYARQRDPQRSVEHLSRAVEIVPTSKLYRNNFGTVLAQSRRYGDAFEQFAAVHPPALAHYNVGVTAKKSGDSAEAMRQFELALQADPNLIAARKQLDQMHAVAAQRNNLVPQVPAQSGGELTLHPSAPTAPTVVMPHAQGPVESRPIVPPPTAVGLPPQTTLEQQAAVRAAEAKLREALQSQPAPVAPSYGSNWVPAANDDITPITSLDQVPPESRYRPSYGPESESVDSSVPVLLPPIR